MSAPPVPPAPFDAALLAVERSLRALGPALVAGDAPQVEALCTALRQQMAALAEPAIQPVRDAGGQLPRGLQERLGWVQQQLLLQRENLVRRAVPVDQAVKAIFPERGGLTYGRGG